MEKIYADSENVRFFLHDLAGVGKIFLCRTIYHYYRAQGRTVFWVAFTGAAASLFPGGTTAHHGFSIPLKLNKESLCYILNDSGLFD